jgi:hypothetical protein
MVYQWFCLKTTGMVCQWFGHKTTGTVSPSLALNPVAAVSLSLGSKLVTSGFLVGALKSPRLFLVLGLKTK